MGYTTHVQDTSAYVTPSSVELGFTLGTRRLCEAMVTLGMAYPTPFPDFPASDHLSAGDFDNDNPVTAAARTYLHVLSKVQADHGTHGLGRKPGIPTHKVCSGDGWHVTADECAEALTAYDTAVAAGAAHPDTFGDDVIPLLRIAATSGGFRVN